MFRGCSQRGGGQTSHTNYLCRSHAKFDHSFIMQRNYLSIVLNRITGRGAML